MPKAFAQAWLERDAWSGPSDDGYSIYPAKEAHALHMKEFQEERNREYLEHQRNKRGTPESYVNPEGSLQEIFVSEDYYAKLLASEKKRDRIYDQDLTCLGDWKAPEQKLPTVVASPAVAAPLPAPEPEDAEDDEDLGPDLIEFVQSLPPISDAQFRQMLRQMSPIPRPTSRIHKPSRRS